MTTDFQAFPKIPRWSRDIIITEKIDGTNACVVIEETERGLEIRAQSRQRFITPESDNYGFAGWVKGHSDELMALGPGRHFGEWWGCGIQRKYGQTEKIFSLFNVSRWDRSTHQSTESGKWRVDGDLVPQFVPPPECCRVVPVLYYGPLYETAIQWQIDNLAATGSAAAPGWMAPEGIVIFHTAGRHLFKKTLLNDASPKGIQ